MKSALVGPVLMFALAILSYLISQQPIISIAFAGVGVLLLLLIPLSIRTGKKIDTMKEMLNEYEQRKKPRP